MKKGGSGRVDVWVELLSSLEPDDVGSEHRPSLMLPKGTKATPLVDEQIAQLLKHRVREDDALDEARAERTCDLGVGCGTSGKCYAEAVGRKNMCGKAAKLPLRSDGFGL